jgi:hypothetical protein
MTSDVSRRLSALGAWWLSRRIWLQASILIGILLVKVGIGIETENVRERLLPASGALPLPVDWYSASFGNLAVARAFGITDLGPWILLHAAIVAIAFATGAVLASRLSGIPRGASWLFLASTTAVATALLTIGKYDAITLFGAFLFVLARSHWLALTGVVVMAAGNPEQTVVAVLGLLAISFVDELRQWRWRALRGLVLAVLMWFGVQFWMLTNGVSGSRLTLLSVWLNDSLDRVARNPLGELWSWFGIAWVVVASVLFLTTGRSRWQLATGLILVPGLVTILTADGARVFGLVSLPALVAVAMHLWRSGAVRESSKNVVVGSYLLAWIAIPTGLGIGSLFGSAISGGVDRITEPLTFWIDAFWYYLVTSHL